MSKCEPNRGLRFCSWNTKGMGQLLKRKKILSTLKAKKYDIVFLQETHLLEIDNKKLQRDWVGLVYYSVGSSASRGVAILVHKHLQFKCNKLYADDQGRVVILLSEIEGRPYIFVNLYAPNLDEPSFFGNLECKITEIQNGRDYPIIIGGDFNQVFDMYLDRSCPSNSKQRRSVEILNNICKDLGLVDIWRLLNPSGRDYTFYSSNHLVYTRIDYFLISHSLIPYATSCAIGSILVSDHAEVSLYIQQPTRIGRSKRWRLNSSLLKDPIFKLQVQEQITLFKDTNVSTAPSPGIAWETLKAFLRGFIIQYTSHKKKKQMAEYLNLEKKVKEAENVFKTNMSDHNLRSLVQLKYQYNSLLSQKLEFLLFRARQRFFEGGDKAGRLLANYIKQQETHSNIPAIHDQQGVLHTSPSDINNTFKIFYEHLYSSESTADRSEIKAFLNNLDLPVLSSDQKHLLDRPITVTEILDVIKSLPTGKAPGPDGFTAEFYKCYACELAPLMLDMYMDSLDKGQLPPTLSQALIVLILKKNKEPTDCRSYRPISLTNYDSRIFSKILANRLNKVVPSLVHPDQVGFIRSRHSSDNIRRLIDIMWAVKDDTSPTAALSLDAEKAFDRVEWVYLFLVLEHLGFGKEFLGLLRLVYRTPTASVMTNGLISPYFRLHRGTRQGDPASPAIFALALEPLAAAIRLDPNFIGVSVGHMTHKVMLYADDILTFIRRPETSVPALLALIDSFSKFSGYKINWSKCEALALTAYCPKTLFHPGNFRWPDQGIRYLGILFPPNLVNIMKVNMDPLLESFKLDIDRWSPLRLSLWAKANILKMTVAPKFNYILQSLPVTFPGNLFRRFEQLCNTFLWNGKRARVRLKKLQQKVNQGGFGIPNLLLYHYAFCLRHLVQWSLPPERAPPWYTAEAYCCPDLPLVTYLSATLPPAVQNHPVIACLKDVWRKTAKILDFNTFLNRSASIWYNPSLRIGKSSFYWKEWVQRGIITLDHIYLDYGLKSFHDLQSEFHLQKHNYWRYIQIRSLLTATFKSPSTPFSADIPSTIVNRYGLGHEASFYYSMLLDKYVSSFSLKKVWERDLSTTFTDDEWMHVLCNSKKMARDLRTRLVQFKIINKMYWTPAKLFRVKLVNSPMCWKCTNDGTLTHMLWECPKVQQFWISIHECIEGVVGVEVPFCIRLYVLGDPSVLKDILPSVEAEWVHTAIMLGKKLIVQQWKSTHAPSIRDWYNALSTVAAYEQISFTQLDRLNWYHCKWHKFIQHLHSPK
ncbi:hypothetical protein ACEWY4_018397 [Coilia grayii]|uniref:Reverse transcriptase domain-containing protein n=1 Tax=Coilia grayii TaxID=363190 RepID=A0ABD1JDC4_9TELE